MAQTKATQERHTHTDACPVLEASPKDVDSGQRILVHAARAPYGCDAVKGRAWTVAVEDTYVDAAGQARSYFYRWSVQATAIPALCRALAQAYKDAGSPAALDDGAAYSTEQRNKRVQCSDAAHGAVTTPYCPVCGKRVAKPASPAAGAVSASDIDPTVLGFA